MPLPSQLDPEATVLFLGAGFNAGALAINGKALPLGDGLAHELADGLGEARGKYSLRRLADMYRRRQDRDLYQAMRRMFVVSTPSLDQREILNTRWQRIYTTNYDNAAETAFHINKIDVKSYSHDDPKPRTVPRGSIVHIHGVISKATEETVYDQLVLGERSYIEQHFRRSPWYDELLRDLRFCDACFFLGYTLQDPHIAALLLDHAETKKKTFFILREGEDPVLLEELAEYGEVHPIRTSGFANLKKTLPKSQPTTDLHRLRAIRYIDPIKDQKAVIKPTPMEVIDLVTFGRFNNSRCFDSLPAPEYVIPRREAVAQAIDHLKSCKTLLVHSRLGNGKSIFLSILAFHFSQQQFRCFSCGANTPAIEYEIRTLVNIPNVIVMFDDYDVAIDVIERFSELLPNAKFVVTARSGVQEARLSEVQERLPIPIRRLDLNLLNAEDREDFIDLLHSASILKSGFADVVRQSRETRDVVTTLYKNKEIKARIEKTLGPITADTSIASVVILGLLMSWSGHVADISYFIDAADTDPLLALNKYKETIADIFQLGDQVKARSAIFSEYLLQNHFDVDTILKVVEKSLVAAVKRRNERRYRAIMRSIMPFANLRRLLTRFPDAGSKIRSLYDRLQRDIGMRGEPLFWLQYSIAMTDAGRLDLAENFLATAYDKAQGIGFATYQIDTQALRVNLLRAAQVESSELTAYADRIHRLAEPIRLMISEERHRSYALNALEGVYAFVERQHKTLDVGGRNRFLSDLESWIDALASLDSKARAYTGSDQLKMQLESAKTLLLGGSKRL